MIQQLRDYLERWRLRRAQRPQAAPCAQQPVDACASYAPAVGEVWTFAWNRLQLNGEEMEAYLDPQRTDALTWCHLLDSLQAYHDWAYANGVPSYPKLARAVAHYRARLLRRVHRSYHERMGGVNLSWGDGHLLLNNVNVRALLAMYNVRPTNKARQFLEGLRAKLALILCQGSVQSQASRATHVAQGLYDDICKSLTRETIDSRCLPPRVCHLDSP